MSCHDLHHALCTNSDEDIERMQLLLERWRDSAEPINKGIALTHAVENGHDKCVNFLFSQGATANMRVLLRSAVLPMRFPAVFELLLKNGGCTQNDINAILMHIGFVRLLGVDHDKEQEHIKLITKHNFKFEDFKLLFNPNLYGPSTSSNSSYTPLAALYVLTSSMLKRIVLNGGTVDHRQLPYQNLTQRQKTTISAIQTFVRDSTFLPPKIPIPEDKLFESLQILRQCGCNFAEVNAEGKSLLDFIEDRKADRKCANRNYCNKLSAKIQEYLKEPLSLQSLSRLSLLKHLKFRYMKCVNTLSEDECPRDLIKFLKGDDMVVTPFHTQSQNEFLTTKHQLSNYRSALLEFLNDSSILPLEMRNTLRSQFVSDVVGDVDIDRLKVEFQKLKSCGHIIMKYMYNIQ